MQHFTINPDAYEETKTVGSRAAVECPLFTITANGTYRLFYEHLEATHAPNIDVLRCQIPASEVGDGMAEMPSYISIAKARGWSL